MPLKTIPLDEPGINLTSMLDVVMLLIMFFMAGTQFKDEEKQYDIQLPTASDATAPSGQPDEVTVNVQRDGRLIVRTEEKSIDQLEALLTEARTRFPGQGVIVRGDAEVPYRFVMDAMSAARRAGIRNVSLAYKPGERP